MIQIVLRPYPTRKDSGLDWIGEIPAHWEVSRNGRLFSQRAETGRPELPVLEISLRTGVTVRDLEGGGRKQAMSDRSRYKVAAHGDIAYNMMRMWQGAVGVAPVDGLVSPAYVVARPRPGIDTRYYAYLFRTNAYMEEVNRRSRGIVSDRNRLYWLDFKQLPVLLPPQAEQVQIAGFLDGHGRAVHRLIRAKQRRIALLNEQKQAVIQRAVTRGIDPDVRLKPSGVEWLGEVPEHWEVRSLKQVATISLSGVDKHSHAGEASVLLCNYTDVYRHEVIDSSLHFMAATASLREVEAFGLRSGDVLITKDSEAWDDIAVPAVVVEDLPGVLCAYHLAVIRPSDVVIGEYLFRVLQAPSVARQFHVAATGVTRYGLSKQSIKSGIVPIPPRSEQAAIVDFIREQGRQLDEAVRRADREIALIREYRTRLIADVVTGKLDVRGVEIPDAEVADEAAASAREPLEERPAVPEYA